jgi:hypothetical protein
MVMEGASSMALGTSTYGEGWSEHDPPEYAEDGRLYVYRSQFGSLSGVSIRECEVGLATLAHDGYIWATCKVEIVGRS